MKKTMVYLSIAVLLLTQGFSFDFAQAADTDTDIEIVSFTTSEDPIKEDDVFTLNLTIKNNSGDNISNMGIIVNQSSDFFRVGVGNAVFVSDTLADGNSIAVPIGNLKRKGSGNKMVLDFQYDKGVTPTTATQTIFLNVTEEGQSAPSQPTDTTRFDPRIGLEDDFKRPILRAGRINTLKLPIVTQTNHSAKNIEVSIALGEKLAEYIRVDQIISQVNLDRLRSNLTEEIEFTLDISPVIDEGIYPVTIKYEYLNHFNDRFTRTETIHVKVENAQTLPNISVNKVGISNEMIHRGDVINFFIDLKNQGTLVAEDVVVSISGLGNELSIYNATNEEQVDDIKGGRIERAHYRLMVANDAKSSNQQFNIKVEYKDEVGNKYLLDNIAFLFLNLDGETSSKSEILIENMVVPESIVHTGEDFLISFDLQNNSSNDLQNIKVTADAGSEIIPKSLNIVTSNLLPAGESKNIYFRLSALDNATTKNYRIALKVEFEKEIGGANIKQEMTEYIGVNIVNEKMHATRTVPKIIIDEFSFGADEVKAGKEFELVISFLNTSRILEARNIKATVVSSDGSFSPLKGSNMFFIDRIPVGERVERSITLFPKVDLLTKSYSIIVKLEYEDEKGLVQGQTGQMQHTADLEINLPVVQEPRLKVDNISIPPEADIGMPIKIYADFFNMGRGTLNNLLVKAEGDFEGDQLSYFVGNFATGGNDFFEATIFPNSVGELNGSIVFVFEDDMGRQKEIREDFSIMIVEQMEGGKFPPDGMGREMPDGFEKGYDMEDPTSQDRRTGTIWVIVVLSVIALGGITIFIIKRRKKRKALEEGMMTDE